MEDFVPFEIAKKLKEKGFNYPCIGHYVNNQLYVAHYQNAFHSDSDESVDAPTISKVLKWLREVKKIFICIDLLESGYCYDIQKNVVINNAEFDFDVVTLMAGCYETYELAALAGIEYILDNNLI